MIASVQRAKSLLSDLGKSTMRGVRKCPQCGTYNGTRSICCKNTACKVVFKERSVRAATSASAVRINTGANSAQLYSVRVRDRGPDYRGFVQVTTAPVMVKESEGAGMDMEVSADVEMCYVDTCMKPATDAPPELDTSTLLDPQGQLQPPPPSICSHVTATHDCLTVAEPLILKNSVLNSLQVSNEVKQSIWLLATETTGPLVQRVSKHVMVVKCKTNPRHPLGFLHFMFYEMVKGNYKFNCSCRAFKTHRIGILRDELQRRCIHFYACICAFASDEKLAEEFSYYISLHTLSAGKRPSASNFDMPQGPAPGDVTTKTDGLQISTNKRIRRDGKFALVSNALTCPSDGSGNVPVRKYQAKKFSSVSIDESKVMVSFHQSLASITERINQTMHYQFEGTPEPLVFHLPQSFFDCLQQRISAGFKKKRLPNSTTAFVRKDALPMGTFSKYTWQITNVLHVKQIFDTAEIPLEITRNFIQNRDGTYDLFETPKGCPDGVGGDTFRKGESQPPIRPFELKTFLKVGNTSIGQRDPTPFVIEWIPDILPKMKIGELRLKFEFGHQRNGQIELRFSSNQQSMHLDSSVI